MKEISPHLTYYEALSGISDPIVRSQALANLPEEKKDKQIMTTHLYHVIDRSYNWSLTPQKHAYWSSVCNLIRAGKIYYQENEYWP